MVWKNPDKPFGQPNTSGSNEILCVVYPSILTILENKTMKLSRYLTLIIPLYADIKNTYFMQDYIFPKKHCEKSGTILHFGTCLVHSGTHVWLIRRQLRFSLCIPTVLITHDIRGVWKTQLCSCKKKKKSLKGKHFSNILKMALTSQTTWKGDRNSWKSPDYTLKTADKY